MSIDLSGRGTVGAALAVRVDIPGLDVIRLSTWHRPLEIEESDGNVYSYAGAGILLTVSETTQELRATTNEITVQLSGIPVNYALLVQQQRFKGSRLDIRRVFTDAVTDEPLSIAGNPVIMFRGIVTNYSFSEQFNQFSRDATLTIGIEAASIIDVLQTKIVGRRTNPEGMRQFYPTDQSFDRVSNISGRPFDFGVDPKIKGEQTRKPAPQAVATSGTVLEQDSGFNNNDSGG